MLSTPELIRAICMGKMSVEDCSETAEQELGLKWEERVWSRLRGFQKASGIVRVAEKKEDGFTQLPKVLCCHEAGQESDRVSFVCKATRRNKFKRRG